jgi:integrase
LTGQREAEIGGLRWDEVHDEYISLPAQRTKNGRAHIIPLADPAKAILAKFQANDRIHVFGRVDTGFTGWGYAKRQFDAHIAKARKLSHWVIHDLRRSVVTRMS